MNTLAIDFGTSRIKAAVWDEDRQEPAALPLGWDRKLYSPSMFYVDPIGDIFLGDEAESMVGINPLGGISNIRSQMRNEWQFLPNGTRIKTEKLLSEMFSSVINYALMQFNEITKNCLIENLIVTLPPDADDCKELYYKSIINTGYSGQIKFMTEAEATVLEWAKQCGTSVGETALIVDVGGECTTFSYQTITGPQRSKGSIEYPTLYESKSGGHYVDKTLKSILYNRFSPNQLDSSIYPNFILNNIRHARESFGGVGLTIGSMGKNIRPIATADNIEYFDQKYLSEAVINVFKEPFTLNLKKMLKGYHSILAEENRLSIVLTGGFSATNAIRKLTKDIIENISNDTKISVDCLHNPALSVVFGAIRSVSNKGSDNWSLFSVKSLNLATLNEWMSTCTPSLISGAKYLRCRSIRSSSDSFKTFCWFTHSSDEEISSNRANGVTFSSKYIENDLQVYFNEGEAIILLSNLRSSEISK